jgi:ATP-binding cassette subfamily F protein uup
VKPKTSASAAAPQSSNAKKKLSFKQKHALETLPKRMEELQATQAKLQKELDDPSLYKRDPKRFAELSQAFAKAADKLAKAEEEWLDLEMLREAVEG